MDLKVPILIAGPCAAETESQIMETAQSLYFLSKKFSTPLTFFRAGIWKPRTNPHSFSGAGNQALPWLQRVKKEYKFPICVEVAMSEHVKVCEEAGIDAFWIGARTTVNPFLIDEIAKSIQDKNRIIMIKNPVTPDLKTWIGAVERFRDEGFNNIVLIHRGFNVQEENALRNSPCWEIPVAMRVQYPDLPMICDPSHISGDKHFIQIISQTALNYGFNGLMVEVHCAPEQALSDASQQITPLQFLQLLQKLNFITSSDLQTESEMIIFRNNIANIDKQIARLLSKRMQIVDEIADFKFKNNLPLIQPSQWNKVVQTYKNEALADEQYEEFIRLFLSLLHNSSLQRQQQKFLDYE